MVNAIVLLNVRPDSINAVAQKMVRIEGVGEVHSVGGRYDLVAIIRARDMDGLAGVVTDQMLKIEGILKSETLFSYRVISDYDLENMFALGEEEE